MRTWLRLHAQAFAAAAHRLGGQPLAFAVSVLVIGVALALPLLAWVAVRSVGAATAGLETEPHANVFLVPDASDADVKRIGDALRGHPETASLRFVSRAEALAELKATTHLAELLAAMEQNPLPHAFTVKLRASDPAKLDAAREAFMRIPGVDQVAGDFEWASRLARWVRLADRILTLGALGLAAAVAFIVGHLIRLQVVTRREEIEVSQLVGATGADVRRPFLYAGLLQGVLSGLVAVAVAAGVSAAIAREMSALAPAYATELKVVFLGPMQALGVVLACAALAWLGSAVAVRREIRRFGQTP